MDIQLDQAETAPLWSQVKATALRLENSADVRQCLTQFAVEAKMEAGSIVTGVGSLSQVALRLAGKKQAELLAGSYELLSLHGTLGAGGVHLHMMVADETGKCLGGHVMEGCIVRTTLELVIFSLVDARFERRLDPRTGFLELEVRSAGAQKFSS